MYIIVFNEGFDILFGIIDKEGGSKDAGSQVIRDCLQIVSNILHNSETCQRLFFDMGGNIWYNRLAEFFHPTILEDPIEGFDSPSKKMCCKYAMIALCNSLESTDLKTKKRLGDSTHAIMSSACFWLSRRSPMDLLQPARNLINQIIFNLNLGVHIPPSSKTDSNNDIHDDTNNDGNGDADNNGNDDDNDDDDDNDTNNYEY